MVFCSFQREHTTSRQKKFWIKVWVAQKKDAGRLDGVKVILGETNKSRITGKTQTAHQNMCHVFTAKASNAKSIDQARVWKPVKQGCAVTRAIRRPILTKKDGVQ